MKEMLENDDSDVDLNLLEELLETAENQHADDQKSAHRQDAKTATNKHGFDSLLEDLDKLPVKTQSGSKLKDITSHQNNDEKAAAAAAVSRRKGNSAIHAGDTDSSDDEDNRRLERRYNEYGASVKKTLNDEEAAKRDSLRLDYGKGSYPQSSTWKSSPSASPGTLCLPSKKKQVSIDVYTEPSIGIRIVNPLVSSTVLKERLAGRKVVSMAQVKQFILDGKHSEDWVICGVIVSKTPPRTSAKGSMYSIIKLSDLRGVGDVKTVSLFLFSRAYKNHGKDTVGTVLGILNPGILDNSRNHGDEACLSVDNSDRIMVLGTSKDFGICKSKKKNGENCTSIVNTAQCEYCVYHVKQEYQKCSRRSDIQSSFNGSGLTNLRNKVLGKNEVFYGGQSFSAIPAKPSKRLAEQDNRRLMALTGKAAGPSPSAMRNQGKPRLATSVELSYRQSQKDIDRLRRLTADDSRALASPSSTSIPQYNPDEMKPHDAKTAAQALVAKKKEAETDDSAREESKLSLPSVKNAVPKGDDDPLYDSAALSRDAAVTKESSGLFRGVAATLALSKSDKTTIMKPSALGLGLKSSLGNASASKKQSVTDEKLPSQADQKHATPGSFKNVKAPTTSNINPKTATPEHSYLNSDQLRKISSTGTDLESRMLKQAALKAAEQEEASKLGTNVSPSMLGLGRARAPRPSADSIDKLRKGLPVLGGGLSVASTIDLNAPIHKKMKDCAKMNAINLIRRTGGLSKQDPNNREFESRKKVIKPAENMRGMKRSIGDTGGDSPGPSKKVKVSAKKQEEEHEAKMARFKELMAQTSKHTELLEAADNKAQDEYFGKLEKKEQLEEKMLNTFKVACKAVRCLTCKYTSFSASEMCKTERHPLKVMDATKRFFKCGDCGNRTVCLELIPLTTCSNCGSSRWERAAMIRERKVGVTQEILSVRGLEEKFIGAVTTGGNLNLLVPEES